jgi:hypothetical protein
MRKLLYVVIFNRNRIFVSGDQVLEVAKKEDARSYDASGAKYGHRKCTFDALIEAFSIQ